MYSVSGFTGYIEEDSSSELTVVVDRPDLPLEVLENSRFNDVTCSMNRGLDDWFESFHSEDDWQRFEDYLESNGFSVGSWEFSFSNNDSLYNLVVSPGIDYSSKNMISKLFRPELEVLVDEVYGADGASYDRVFSMEADNPGMPEPVFRKVLGKLADYSDELIVEALEREVY